ncbi:cytochrome b [Aliidiomarina minuta]|uniref:Cytochrome b n=1 Tax=Aliidiomarina minuta TaxID=880057 RepID=A0A432W140_9GAMM|nr:cytochrome b [Aliidiomarina minuta]RUO22917.1 cytochrome b [Aliidiomarina minuta]
MIRNTRQRYGLMSAAIHWLTAITVIALFALGWWMLTLTYYDTWYRLGPWWHKSFGISLLMLTLFRVFWMLINPKPKALGSQLEKAGAKLGHLLLYLLLFTVMISGYLISTADGRSISVFDWFSVPALITGIPYQEDIAGEVHWYAACALMILAAGHALMALKHQFIDKHPTLTRMFTINPEKKS